MTTSDTTSTSTSTSALTGLSESTEGAMRAPHVYDGIEEHDNRLPRWWLMTLWGAIGFGVAYWFAYQTFGLAPQPRAVFEAQMSARRAAEERVITSRVGSSADVAGVDLVALKNDPAVVARGKTLYQATCLACHADKGQGLVGPNLTDDAWLHGSTPKDIHRTVALGVAEKGMPAWKDALGATQVNEVVAFVLSIQGTHVAGKEPQGVVSSN